MRAILRASGSAVRAFCAASRSTAGRQGKRARPTRFAAGFASQQGSGEQRSDAQARQTKDSEASGEGGPDSTPNDDRGWAKKRYDSFWDREMEKRAESKMKKEQGRKKLDEELKRSKMQDHYDVAHKYGRVFETQQAMDTATNAISFPSITVELLNGSKIDLRDEVEGNVTMVCMFGTAAAQTYAEPWITEFEALKNGTQLFQVSVNESWYSQMLSSIARWNLRRAIPAEQHGRFGCVYGSIKPQRDKMGLINPRSNYMLLVDGRGKVRWKTSGRPPEEELGQLYDFTTQLLKEGGVR